MLHDILVQPLTSVHDERSAMSFSSGDSQSEAIWQTGTNTHPNSLLSRNFKLPSLPILLRALRSGTLSSEAVTRLLLTRLEERNPRLNMVIESRAEAAMAEALASDRRRAAGKTQGPLDGLPVSIKDSLDTAGIVTTSGCLHRRGRVPEADATSVSRWRTQGTPVLCKSNVPELAYGIETDNLLIGRTGNPWDPAFTIGGSSGGEAALVASGCSILGMGSDICGSLRLPAHFGGVCSLKVTNNAVTKDGHPPRLPDFIAELAAVGPVARSVQDVAVGYLGLLDARAQLQSLIDAPEAALACDPGQIVVSFSDDRHLSPACREAVEAAAQALTRLGYRVSDETPEAFLAADQLWEELVRSDGNVSVREAVADGRPLNLWLELFRNLLGKPTRHYLPLMWAVMGMGKRFPSYSDANARRARLWESIDRSLPAGAVFLSPVAPEPAHKAARLRPLGALLKYVKPANTYGLPALTIPVRQGAPGRMPVAIQLMGRPGEDWRVLQVGHQLEKALAQSP